MLISERTKKRWNMGFVILAGSSLFQLGIGSCRELAYLANPCGTILAFCTQEQIDNLNNPIPNWEDHPECTIPGACGESPFPPGPGPRPEGPPPP